MAMSRGSSKATMSGRGCGVTWPPVHPIAERADSMLGSSGAPAIQSEAQQDTVHGAGLRGRHRPVLVATSGGWERRDQAPRAIVVTSARSRGGAWAAVA